MKGTKEQKGITLVALIITIVVLLILAAVAISGITNDGILHYAQNSADSWNKAAQDEAGILQNYLAYIDPCGAKGEHTYGEWITLAEAGNCQTKVNGSKERTCSVCGYKQTETIYWKHLTYDPYCDLCQEICNHELYIREDWYPAYYYGEMQHATGYLCRHCEYWESDMVFEPCQFKEGKCTICGGECTHPNNRSYTYIDASTHKVQEGCPDCGLGSGGEATTEPHSVSGGTSSRIDDEKHSITGTCIYCNTDVSTEEPHEWTFYGLGTEIVESNGHKRIYDCHCGATKFGELETHSWATGNLESVGIDGHKLRSNCMFCSATELGELQPHNWEIGGNPISGGADGHFPVYTCYDCGESKKGEIEPHGDYMQDGMCMACGWSE